MRITMEADYAIRIVHFLAVHGERADAKTISGETDVTLRFALKILHKLVQNGIAKSFKGVNGGYCLQRAPADISMRTVIEAIDGPVALNRCLQQGEACVHMVEKGGCVFHKEFARLSNLLEQEMESASFADLIEREAQ